MCLKDGAEGTEAGAIDRRGRSQEAIENGARQIQRECGAGASSNLRYIRSSQFLIHVGETFVTFDSIVPGPPLSSKGLFSSMAKFGIHPSKPSTRMQADPFTESANIWLTPLGSSRYFNVGVVRRNCSNAIARTSSTMGANGETLFRDHLDHIFRCLLDLKFEFWSVSSTALAWCWKNNVYKGTSPNSQLIIWGFLTDAKSQGLNIQSGATRWQREQKNICGSQLRMHAIPAD